MSESMFAQELTTLVLDTQNSLTQSTIFPLFKKVICARLKEYGATSLQEDHLVQAMLAQQQ